MMRHVHLAGQSLPLGVQSTSTTTLTSLYELEIIASSKSQFVYLYRLLPDICKCSYMLTGTAFNVRQLCIVLS